MQQAAWKFVAAWSNHAKDMFNIAGLYQAKADFVQSDEFKKNSYMPIFLGELAASTYHPRIAGFFEVADALLRGRDRIVTGHEDIDKVLAETQIEVSDILARAKADAQKK